MGLLWFIIFNTDCAVEVQLLCAEGVSFLLVIVGSDFVWAIILSGFGHTSLWGATPRVWFLVMMASLVLLSLFTAIGSSLFFQCFFALHHGCIYLGCLPSQVSRDVTQLALDAFGEDLRRLLWCFGTSVEGGHHVFAALFDSDGAQIFVDLVDIVHYLLVEVCGVQLVHDGCGYISGLSLLRSDDWAECSLGLVFAQFMNIRLQAEVLFAIIRRLLLNDRREKFGTLPAISLIGRINVQAAQNGLAEWLLILN